jgi:superfamily II DNA or RNA helicase
MGTWGNTRSTRCSGYPEAKRIALSALRCRHRDTCVLVFTSDNHTAYTIAREFLIMPITCDIDRKEREVALKAFRAGELRALVSAQVLNEGLDVPDADVAIIVGGNRGRREHLQRVGRHAALRLYRGPRGAGVATPRSDVVLPS